MQAVNYESNLQHAVIGAEANARYEYFKLNQMLNKPNYDTYVGIVGVISDVGLSNSTWTYRLTNTKGLIDPKLYKSGWIPRGAVGKGLNVYNISACGEGISRIANVYSTAYATYEIANGEAEPITYVDAAVGWAAVSSDVALAWKGSKIPYIGEFALVYGIWRTALDLGFYFGPSHWYGKDNKKWFK